jgi:hypothetical protein
MTSQLDNLYAINATTTSNDTDLVHNYDHAQELVVELIQEPVNEAMSGTLWLFPTAVSIQPLFISWNTGTTTYDSGSRSAHCSFRVSCSSCVLRGRCYGRLTRD